MKNFFEKKANQPKGKVDGKIKKRSYRRQEVFKLMTDLRKIKKLTNKYSRLLTNLAETEQHIKDKIQDELSNLV